MRHILLVFVAIMAHCATVFAHSPFDGSFPKDGTLLSHEPEKISLSFARPTRVMKVTLTRKSADVVERKKLKIPSHDPIKKIGFLPEIEGDGDYKVEWRALAEDGHAMSGSFEYSVKQE